MNKGMYTLIGFVLFSLGVLALVLSLIGLKFSFLTWIDKPGPLFGFVIRLLMIMAGVVIIVLAQGTPIEEDPSPPHEDS